MRRAGESLFEDRSVALSRKTSTINCALPQSSRKGLIHSRQVTNAHLRRRYLKPPAQESRRCFRLHELEFAPKGSLTTQ